jgi:60 kDa SS-A/Ro ribonucleoprotein
MLDFTKHVSTRLRRLITPQAEPIPESAQVQNSAGGYSWPVDHWTRLDRFLILGSEGGTFYVGERPLTRENAQGVTACIAEDGTRVVHRVVEISASGRAPKNDPALFVLAIRGRLRCGHAAGHQRLRLMSRVPDHRLSTVTASTRLS